MKKYWKEIESLRRKGSDKPAKKSSEDNSLFTLLGDVGTKGSASRRDFLKLCGFSFAVTTLASCQTKVRKAVPYVAAPLEVTPGEANYYASSYIMGNDYCSIVVKTREGRPIKIEGNPGSGISMGGSGARVQASVLDLYDGSRFRGPLKEATSLSWDSIDAEILSQLKDISGNGGAIVLLTPTIFSPSTESVINEFIEHYPGSEWIQYDPLSRSAILEANMISFGEKVIPDYRFGEADIIVSFGADFLGSWISPVEYTKQYSSRRDPDKEMNHLVVFESNLSVTGSNADRRITIKPSQETAILLNIYREIKSEEGIRVENIPDSPVDVSDISKQLLKARGKSIIVSSSNDRDIQVLVNEINRSLGNKDTTIRFENHLRTYNGIDSDIENLVNRMKNGEIEALILADVNPAYNFHNTEAFKEGLKKVKLTISLGKSPDETSDLVKYICPDNHFLESWNDAEAKKNKYSLGQPVITPLFDTRQMQDSLLVWSEAGTGYGEFLKNWWIENLMPLQSVHFSPQVFFDHVLQEGVFEPDAAAGVSDEQVSESLQDNNNGRNLFDPSSLVKKYSSSDNNIEVVLYESVAIGIGNQANNPWLHELPDSLTRICWDNYVTLSPRQAREAGVTDGDIIRLDKFDFPVHIQPGQAYGTAGIALGYGRRVCGRVGKNLGKDAWPLTSEKNGNRQYTLAVTEIVPTGETYKFAQTQTHHSMEGRALVREAGLKEYKQNKSAGNELHRKFEEKAKSLYKEREYPHHHWGMAIDLGRCTGCSNCVIACQAENNIPVVGKDEVIRVHEMHWMRIDRYFSGSEDNPEVVFQPVMCQHCDNAPCENVCPVAATNQSSEGLNQMVYNRCIGTRYCNNNCPYKVRRFNWFNYTEAGTLTGNLHDKSGMTDDMRRLVLNPDVTVRSQGVIEKCSLCVQRIQAAKLKAKGENRALEDGEIKTACSQSCPADAIVFGDMNDPQSEISKLMASNRRYNLLEEIFTKPSVQYLTKIRNKLT